MLYTVPHPTAENRRQISHAAASGAMLARASPADQTLMEMVITKKHRFAGALLLCTTNIPVIIDIMHTEKNSIEKIAE